MLLHCKRSLQATLYSTEQTPVLNKGKVLSYLTFFIKLIMVVRKVREICGLASYKSWMCLPAMAFVKQIGGTSVLTPLFLPHRKKIYFCLECSQDV